MLLLAAADAGGWRCTGRSGTRWHAGAVFPSRASSRMGERARKEGALDAGFARRDSRANRGARAGRGGREFFSGTTALIARADRRMEKKPRQAARGFGGSTISHQTAKNLYSHAVRGHRGASARDRAHHRVGASSLQAADPGDLPQRRGTGRCVYGLRGVRARLLRRAHQRSLRGTGDRTRRLALRPKENNPATRTARFNNRWRDPALASLAANWSRTRRRTKTATETPVAEPSPLDQEDEE